MERKMTTRAIVRAGMIAAAYWIVTVLLAPISYGPVQLRLSGALYPLALLAPEYALGFAVGSFLANLQSPFGLWDFAIMPLVTFSACTLAYRLRRWPLAALALHCVIIAAGVALFPLGFGASLPPLMTFPGVLLSQLVVVIGAHVAWRAAEWAEGSALSGAGGAADADADAE